MQPVCRRQLCAHVGGYQGLATQAEPEQVKQTIIIQTANHQALCGHVHVVRRVRVGFASGSCVRFGGVDTRFMDMITRYSGKGSSSFGQGRTGLVKLIS